MAEMIDANNIELARKQIRTAKRPSIVMAKGDEFNRTILEYGKFDVLLSVEAGNRRDKIKQLDSGLNEVIAKIAAKNNVAIGIDLGEIYGLDKKEKAVRLARIKQNIEICRKAGAGLAVLNCADKRSAFSLLISLGASSKQAAQAITF
jgi:RNase P/RNase MRP subunit p30